MIQAEAVLTPHEWEPVLSKQHNYKYHKDAKQAISSSRGMLKELWSQDHKRTTEYDAFSRLWGYAAVAQLWAYWEVMEPTGEVVGTHIFLPSSTEEAKRMFWGLFFTLPPGHYDPEYRTMVREMQMLEGESLVGAQSSAQLLDHVQWAAIGSCSCYLLFDLPTSSGWLAIYASGYLHRDISVGNVLRIDLPASVTSVADRLKELTDRQIRSLTYANQVDTPSPQPKDEAGEDARGSSDQTIEQSPPPISVHELRL